MNLKKEFILTAALLQGASLYAAEKPNLLFIMADQWRGDALGFLNKEPVKTPNLDKLVKEGVSFNQAVSSYPVSSPARAMLMSGVYPHKTGVPENCNSVTAPFGVELDNSLVCWSDVLSKEGYNLGYIGKWHLDAPHEPYINTANNVGNVKWNEWTPPHRRHGFTYWHAYGTYDRHLNPMYWDTNSAREDFFYAKKWGPEYEAQKAINFIKTRDNAKPFALVVSMNPPHTGYEAVPNKYKRIYKNLDTNKLIEENEDLKNATPEMKKFFAKNVKNYYACMTGVDEQVGKLIDELKKLNLFDNTLIVFTSDHGDALGRHNLTGKNMYYENSMRIPLIMSYPNKIKPRIDDTTLIAYADLYPTMLSLMGFKQKIPKTVQTYNLVDAVIGNSNAYFPVYQPYYKMVAGGEETIKNNVTTYTKNEKRGNFRGLRYHKWTYVVEIFNGKIVDELLYDRENDPFQLENVANSNLDKTKKFKADLYAFLEKTGDNVLTRSYLK